MTKDASASVAPAKNRRNGPPVIDGDGEPHRQEAGIGQ
jgi:hypothetical protein